MNNLLKQKTLKYKLAQLESTINDLQAICESTNKQNYKLQLELQELKDKFKTLDDYIASKPWERHN